MKKEPRLLMAVIFALTIFIASHSQLPEGIRKEKEIKRALCHTWNLNYKVGFTNAMEDPTESFPTIEFLDNSGLIINKSSSKVAFWKYDKNSHVLIVDSRGRTESYKVLKLTNKELVLQAIDGREKQIRYWRND